MFGIAVKTNGMPAGVGLHAHALNRKVVRVLNVDLNLVRILAAG
jgi:hypothetical protein